MAITQKFDGIDGDKTKHWNLGGADIWAQARLEDLHLLNQIIPESTYAWSSWGYTILRTVYTEESNALIPIAMNNLQRWLTQFWLHYTRRCGYGEKGRARQILDGSLNEELGRRLCFEIVQDQDDARLRLPHLNKADQNAITSLVEVFHDWVKSLDHPHLHESNPRFNDFLVLDQDALDSLLKLGDDMPPFRVADDIPEMQKWKAAGWAWLWFFEAAAVQTPVEEAEAKDRGWMKIGIHCLDAPYFHRVRRWRSDLRPFSECRERPENSGEFWYSNLY